MAPSQYGVGGIKVHVVKENILKHALQDTRLTGQSDENTPPKRISVSTYPRKDMSKIDIFTSLGCDARIVLL